MKTSNKINEITYSLSNGVCTKKEYFDTNSVNYYFDNVGNLKNITTSDGKLASINYIVKDNLITKKVESTNTFKIEDENAINFMILSNDWVYNGPSKLDEISPNDDDEAFLNGNPILKIDKVTEMNYDETYLLRTLYKFCDMEQNNEKGLMINVCAKGDVLKNEIFRVIIELYNGTTMVDSFGFDFDKNNNNWQCLSSLVYSNNSFNRVKVKIEYNGQEDCLIGYISISKKTVNTIKEYDEYGKCITVVGDDTYERYIYDYYGRVAEKINSDGSIYYYEYDYHDQIQKVFSSDGYTMEYTRDDKGHVIEKVIKQNDMKILSESYTYDSFGNVLTYTDYYGNVFTNKYDSRLRLIEETIDSNLVKKYTYNNSSDISNITFRDSEGLEQSHDLGYNDIKTLDTMINTDSDTYKFKLDEVDRINSVYKNLDSKPYVCYQYANTKDDIANDFVISKSYGTSATYDFTYNTKHQIINVKENATDLVTYSYNNDLLNNIKDHKNNLNTNYFYDNKDRIKAEKNTNNTTNYCYDKLGNIKKVGYKDEEGKNAGEVGYFYSYEQNKILFKNYLAELESNYNCEVIRAANYGNGLYGAKPHTKLMFNSFDEELKMNVLCSESKSDCMLYYLDTFNQNRELSKNIKFDINKWRNTFKNIKTFMTWFKPTGLFNNYSIFRFEKMKDDETVDWMSKVIVKANGQIAYVNKDNVEVCVTNNAATKDVWNFVGIKFYKYDSKTKAILTINYEVTAVFDVPEEVEQIDRVYLCNDYDVNEEFKSTSEVEAKTSYMYTKICTFLVGAYDFTPLEFKQIYSKGLNCFYYSRKYNNCHFYDINTYKDFDVITLNGDFNSTNGLMPLEIKSAYNFSSNTIDDCFIYDEDNNRYLYKSISKKEGSKDGSLLSYVLPIEDKGTIAIKFKPTVMDGSSKTVWSLYKNGSVFLRCCIDSNGILKQEINGNYVWNSLSSIELKTNKWYTLIFSYRNINNQGRIITYLYDGTDEHSIIKSIASIDSNNVILYVGSNKGTDIFDGYFKMLAFSNESLLSNENKYDILKMRQIMYNGDLNFIRYECDTLGRIISRKIVTENNVLQTTYNYDKYHITKETFSDGSKIEYEYDSNGLINSKKYTDKNNNVIYNDRYIYDNFGRLKQEKDKNDYTIDYNYDTNGNILSIKYPDPLINIGFRYDSDDKDKLIGIYDYLDEKGMLHSVEYDENYVFNPTKIFKIKDFTHSNLEWLGRKLIKYDDVEFKYNCHDVRIEKESSANKTEYILEGDRIKGMKVFDKTTNENIRYDFVYNTNNEVEAVYVNNNYYYYERDITKNINKILDSSGQTVVSYRYDAWGNVLEEVVKNTILRFNPFLYKGYVYDKETQLYWVSSRYYSPELCRWISPDSIEYLDPESINGLNLYAYCGNDPVNRFDPTGHFGIGLTLLIATGVGLAFGFGIEVVKQASDGGKFWDLSTWNWNLSTWNWWEIGKASLMGAATGFAYGLGGVAGGIVKGSFKALTIAGKALTVSQSVGLLLGTAAVTNFAAGVAGYAMHTAGSETESFNILKGISEGIGQTGKGVLSFFTAGMYVGSGVWKVGVGAKNTFSSILGRAAGRFIANYVPNYMFENLF